MNRLIRLACLVLAAALLHVAAPASAQPLLSPAELAARLSDPDLRIVDIRAGREANGKSPYDNGHIPGAQSAVYPQWRGPRENPGKLLPAAQLTQLVQQLGIERDTPVVVVVEGADSTDFGAAARVAWTLRAGGVRKVSILNGGMTAWRAAGLPVTTQVVDALPTPFELKFDPKLLATRAEVEQIVAARAGSPWKLLDARPLEYFRGEVKHGAASRPGTIVGAKPLDNSVWFVDDSAVMRSPEEIRAIAQREGVADVPTVSFCNSGHWAATNWFVLHEILGVKDVKLYPESLIEWSNADLAMDNVPTRLEQFWRQIRAAFAGP